MTDALGVLTLVQQSIHLLLRAANSAPSGTLASRAQNARVGPSLRLYRLFSLTTTTQAKRHRSLLKAWSMPWGQRIALSPLAPSARHEVGTSPAIFRVQNLHCLWQSLIGVLPDAWPEPSVGPPSQPRCCTKTLAKQECDRLLQAFAGRATPPYTWRWPCPRCSGQLKHAVRAGRPQRHARVPKLSACGMTRWG